MCNFKRSGQTVSSNGKFRSFLVRILIRKDNTDNTNFKRNFIQKKQGRKGEKRLRELIWENVRETKFFEFFFCFCFVEMFQFSFNFEFSLKLFSEEFLLEFSFNGRISVVVCPLFWLLFLGKLLACLNLSAVQEANDETFLPWQFGPRILAFFLKILVLFLRKLLALTVWNTYRLFKKRVTKPFSWLFFLPFSLVPEYVLRVPIVVLDK